MQGYHGRFLEVDLNTKTTTDFPLSEDFCKDYIGGATMAAALVFDRVKAGTDPLAPENAMVMATGPFTGTSLPMVSRYAIGGLSPLTGFWGEATSGGVFPFRLKGAGWDGIIITGKAASPVYLYLNNGQAEIRDAGHLWGKDSYETQKLIKEERGNDKAGVACIGPAGENLIRYACVINDRGRAAGRCGFGALMGSKNLKAVVAAGNTRPESADAGKVSELAKQAVKDIKGNLVSVALSEYGTLMYMDMGMVLGDTPAKYFTSNVFPVSEVTGQALRQNYTVANYACRGCPIGCGRELKNFKPDLDIDGPEYETTVGFGPLCLNTDFDTIIEANHICNCHGIDTISAGVSVAYAFYLYEQGVLTKDQVGIELNWGDGRAVVDLVQKIVDQEGIGVLLSKGVLAMARELGRDEGEAAQVKGLEMPMHEGRAFHGLAVSYATGPRGACHLKGPYYDVDLGNMVLEYMILPSDRLVSAGKGEPAAKFQSFKDLFDALTLCKFAPLQVPQLCDMLNALTGWNFGPEELLAAGDRSINIKRAVSNRFGLTRDHDILPKICLDALDEGTTAGVAPDMEVMLREYYQYRGWDWATGRPTRDKLVELGLNQVAEDFYPQ
ncbi:MAG: aldehyde ferredoxin oxidoreductase family protein [Deltaproteobacteria bacterium]|jgi:aldehyde:ferredoxin oxidoreductase|nr:aldehyde ferredoxin oxidoreductase family protein [Deltaproteobacteria bacterium]